MSEELQNPTENPILAEDGIGISLEEARLLLLTKNEVGLSKDDPILMQVTLLNAYCTVFAQMFKKHQQALAGLMETETSKYNSKLAEITEKVTQVTDQGLSEAVQKNLANLIKVKRDMYWLSAIMFVSAVVNVTVFILRGF